VEKRARAATVPKQRVDSQSEATSQRIPDHHFQPLVVSQTATLPASDLSTYPADVPGVQTPKASRNLAPAKFPVATPIGRDIPTADTVQLANAVQLIVSPQAINACRDICGTLLANSGKTGVIWGIVSLEPEPQEFSAVALAAGMASGNWGPVLLIDATQPKPGDWRNVSAQGPALGLADCTRGAATFDQVARGTNIAGLTLLPRGSNPTGNWQAPAAIAGPMRRRFRFSFVDFGSLDTLGQADFNLASDGILLVCPENLNRPTLRKCAKLISNISSPILGTILLQK
jgi:hypothetical protein